MYRKNTKLVVRVSSGIISATFSTWASRPHETTNPTLVSLFVMFPIVYILRFKSKRLSCQHSYYKTTLFSTCCTTLIKQLLWDIRKYIHW